MTRLSRLFPGRSRSVAAARSFAWAFVVGRVPDDVVHSVELVVSELATNAVAHTASGQPGGHFVLELEMLDGAVRVGVVDGGAPGAPTKSEGAPDFDATAGRGLFIVDAVAKQWAAESVRVGRRVWAELAAEV